MRRGVAVLSSDTSLLLNSKSKVKLSSWVFLWPQIINQSSADPENQFVQNVVSNKSGRRGLSSDCSRSPEGDQASLASVLGRSHFIHFFKTVIYLKRNLNQLHNQIALLSWLKLVQRYFTFYYVFCHMLHIILGMQWYIYIKLFFLNGHFWLAHAVCTTSVDANF